MEVAKTAVVRADMFKPIQPSDAVPVLSEWGHVRASRRRRVMHLALPMFPASLNIRHLHRLRSHSIRLTTRTNPLIRLSNRLPPPPTNIPHNSNTRHLRIHPLFRIPNIPALRIINRINHPLVKLRSTEFGSV
jgi:hypothetical protein